MSGLEFHTIHWLPQHLAEMREWQEICKAYDYLLAKTFEDVDEIYANQFLDSLTEIGCLLWERLLGITVTEDETLEDRRQAIKSYFIGDLPYTENKLREVLESLAGPENVTLKVTQSIYELRVDLTISTPAVISNVEDIVYKMRPSNMVVRICISYDYKDPVYVGLALKQTKTLYPTDIETSDPIAGLAWYVDHDEALLVDTDGSVFISNEEA